MSKTTVVFSRKGTDSNREVPWHNTSYTVLRSIISCDLPTFFSKKMGLQNIIIFSLVVQGIALEPEESGVSERKETETHEFRNTPGLLNKYPCILYDTGTAAREIRERIVLMTDNITLSNQHLIMKISIAIIKEYCVFVSTLAKKESDIDNMCPVNGSDFYMETFETYDMCPLWTPSFHIYDRSHVRKNRTLNEAKHSHLKPKSEADYKTNVENEPGPNSKTANNTGTEKHSPLKPESETGNNTQIEMHNEEVEGHIKSKDENDTINNRLFRSTVRTLFRVVVASAVDYDTLPGRRFNVLNNNGTEMHGNLLTQAYSILTAMNNFLDTINAYSAFVFSYIWIPIEVVYSFFESILGSVEEYVDYFLRIVLEYPGQFLATLLGYPFQGLVIACQYIFWAIGSIFNTTICAYIQTLGEYILEWPLSMLGLGLQKVLMFLVHVLIFIVTDVLLTILFVVLKLLTALICYYLPNVIYFILHGTVNLIVHLLKLVVIYPLVFIMFWVFENVYVMTFGMLLVTLALYVGIFILSFACLRFTYEKYQRIRVARYQSRWRLQVAGARRRVVHRLRIARRLADRLIGHMRGNINGGNDGVTEAIYELNQQFDDDQDCVICFESKQFVRLIPCHHSTMCQDCILKIMGTTKTCPLCRENIREYQCNLVTF